jgi:hypothetical protein
LLVVRVYKTSSSIIINRRLLSAEETFLLASKTSTLCALAAFREVAKAARSDMAKDEQGGTNATVVSCSLPSSSPHRRRSGGDLLFVVAAFSALLRSKAMELVVRACGSTD